MPSEPNFRHPGLDDIVSSATSRTGAPSVQHTGSSPTTEVAFQPVPTVDTATITPPKKARNTPKRTRQIMTRLNQKEHALFLRRLERSGLPQGEYLRQMALTGQVTVVDRNELLIAVLDMLADIRTDLGKQNGMLKMILRPNEGQRQLAPAEWETLIKFLRQNEASARMISDIKEILHGNR